MAPLLPTYLLYFISFINQYSYLYKGNSRFQKQINVVNLFLHLKNVIFCEQQPFRVNQAVSEHFPDCCSFLRILDCLQKVYQIRISLRFCSMTYLFYVYFQIEVQFFTSPFIVNTVHVCILLLISCLLWPHRCEGAGGARRCYGS